MTDQEFEIERLRDRIWELERDNEALKKEVVDLKQKLEQIRESSRKEERKRIIAIMEERRDGLHKRAGTSDFEMMIKLEERRQELSGLLDIIETE